MIRIKLTTVCPEWPFIRQTPGGKGIWGDCQFLINDDSTECDWWFVVDDPTRTVSAACDASRTVLLTGDPPSIKSYPEGFLAQFATVITCHDGFRHPGVIHSQQALPWLVGWRKENGQNTFSQDYDSLKALTEIKKSKELSVAVTGKAITEGHRARLALARALTDALGDRIDVFFFDSGNSYDKWDFMAPYKYHVVMENSSCRDYWSEKLSDCILAGAFPIYYGCPNLSDYFPPESFAAFDVRSPGQAVKVIEGCIRDKRYENSFGSLRAARELVLDKYNLFALIAEFVGKEAQRPANPKPLTIHPMDHFHRRNLIRGLARRARKLLPTWLSGK